MDEFACPCGLGDGYDACCGRLHGGAPASTAEQLMRSRYSAFAVGDTAYLLRTWHPASRPRTLRLDPARRWTCLAVLETHGGGLFDTTGTVRFRAMYADDGQRGVQAETSRFTRQDGRWVYVGPVAELRSSPSTPTSTSRGTPSGSSRPRRGTPRSPGCGPCRRRRTSRRRRRRSGHKNAGITRCCGTRR